MIHSILSGAHFIRKSGTDTKVIFPTDETLYLHDTNMDVHYFYSFESKGYKAEVDEVSQLIRNYEYLQKAHGKKLTNQEYKRKSIAFLERHGRVLHKDHIETKVSQEDGQTVVRIYLKNQLHKKIMLMMARYFIGKRKP